MDSRWAARELRTIRRALEGLREALEKHSDAVGAEQEQDRDFLPAGV